MWRDIQHRDCMRAARAHLMQIGQRNEHAAAARVLFDQYSRTDLHWNIAEREREIERERERASVCVCLHWRLSADGALTVRHTPLNWQQTGMWHFHSLHCEVAYMELFPRHLTSECWNSFGNARYTWMQLCCLLVPNFLFPLSVLQPSTLLISCRWPDQFFGEYEWNFSS